jgi:WD40 repeat protein
MRRFINKATWTQSLLIAISAFTLFWVFNALAAPAASASKPIAEYQATSGVRSMALSRDGKLIAAGLQEGPIVLLEMAGLRLRSSFSKQPPASPECLTFTRDASTIIAGTFPGEYQLWSTRDSKLLRSMNGEGLASAVAVSVDGKQILTFPTGSGIGVFDAQSGVKKAVRALLGRGGDRVPGKAEFSRDGALLAVSGVTDDDHSVLVWDSLSGKLVRRFEQEKLVDCLAVTPDGQLLVSGDQGGLVCVKNLKTGKDAAQWKVGGFVTAVALSDDGQRVALSTDADPDVQVRALANGKVLARLPGHPDGARRVAFSTDGKLLITAATGRIRLWRLP